MRGSLKMNFNKRLEKKVCAIFKILCQEKKLTSLIFTLLQEMDNTEEDETPECKELLDRLFCRKDMDDDGKWIVHEKVEEVVPPSLQGRLGSSPPSLQGASPFSSLQGRQQHRSQSYGRGYHGSRGHGRSTYHHSRHYDRSERPERPERPERSERSERPDDLRRMLETLQATVDRGFDMISRRLENIEHTLSFYSQPPPREYQQQRTYY